MINLADAMKRADHPFTYGEYCTWPEDERWELIEGVAYDMSPAPGRRHQAISFELSAQIARQLKDTPCRGFHAPFDILLPERADQRDEEVTTVVQPDLLIVCDESKLSEKGCRGAPDFIVEILSPTTMLKDSRRKAALYERFGVREYWLIDPGNRVAHVLLLGEDGTYGEVCVHSSPEKVRLVAVEGVEIDLADLFAED